MLRRVRDKLTYANVMSTIAVFGVLGGGTAYAVVVGKDTVVSSSIKDGQVKAQDLAGSDRQPALAKAVTGAKIANGAVTRRTLAPDAVTSAAVGKDALTGDDIQEAFLGTVPSATALDAGQTVFGQTVDIAVNEVKDAVATCPTGWRAAGGGYAAWSDDGNGGFVRNPTIYVGLSINGATDPAIKDDGVWEVEARNWGNVAGHFVAQASCIQVRSDTTQQPGGK